MSNDESRYPQQGVCVCARELIHMCVCMCEAGKKKDSCVISLCHAGGVTNDLLISFF